MSELELLERLGTPVPPPTVEARDAARRALERHVALSAAPPAPAPRRRRLRPRWRFFALPAVATVAVAAAALVLVGTDDGGGPAPASAATVLRHAAAAARDGAPAQTPGPGQYLYTESVGAVLYVNQGKQVIRRIVPLRREAWRDRHGVGWLRTRGTGTARWLAPRDRAAWVAAGRPRLGTGASDVSLERVRDVTDAPLPSTPAAVARQLRAAATPGGTPVDQQVFLAIGDALRRVSTTATQRATLYDVAARLPGVRLQRHARDAQGRPGVAVAMDVPTKAMRLTLVFAPDTYALLGETTSALPHNEYGVPAGTRLGWTAYVRTAVVDRVRERP